MVIAIPNLYAVETVDSIKKADTLNKACAAVRPDIPLKVFVQVNTSAEDGNRKISLIGMFPNNGSFSEERHIAR